jgi:GNAT superfamily N-acetyltransferase
MSKSCGKNRDLHINTAKCGNSLANEQKIWYNSVAMQFPSPYDEKLRSDQILNYQIESLQVEDLATCLQTIHRAFLINCERFGFTKENYPGCAAFMTLDELIADKRGGAHVYAIRVDGLIAGCVTLKRINTDTYAFRRFAVLPEYQNLGLGKALVQHCKQKAKEYGGKRMQLLMVYENEPLRKLYESYGFALIETRRDDEHPFLCGIYEMNL